MYIIQSDRDCHVTMLTRYGTKFNITATIGNESAQEWDSPHVQY